MRMCVTISPSRRRLTTGVAAACWVQGVVAAAGNPGCGCGSGWNAEALACVAGLIDSVKGMNGADMDYGLSPLFNLRSTDTRRLLSSSGLMSGSGRVSA